MSSGRPVPQLKNTVQKLDQLTTNILNIKTIASKNNTNVSAQRNKVKEISSKVASISSRIDNLLNYTGDLELLEIADENTAKRLESIITNLNNELNNLGQDTSDITKDLTKIDQDLGEIVGKVDAAEKNRKPKSSGGTRKKKGGYRWLFKRKATGKTIKKKKKRKFKLFGKNNTKSRSKSRTKTRSLSKTYNR